jgi:hypothetical protein
MLRPYCLCLSSGRRGWFFLQGGPGFEPEPPCRVWPGRETGVPAWSHGLGAVGTRGAWRWCRRLFISLLLPENHFVFQVVRVFGTGGTPGAPQADNPPAGNRKRSWPGGNRSGSADSARGRERRANCGNSVCCPVRGKALRRERGAGWAPGWWVFFRGLQGGVSRGIGRETFPGHAPGRGLRGYSGQEVGSRMPAWSGNAFMASRCRSGGTTLACPGEVRLAHFRDVIRTSGRGGRVPGVLRAHGAQETPGPGGGARQGRPWPVGRWIRLQAGAPVEAPARERAQGTRGGSSSCSGADCFCFTIRKWICNLLYLK